MLKVERTTLTLGYEKEPHDLMMKISELAGVPKEEAEHMAAKAFIYGDLRILIDGISKEFNNDEAALELWTKVAEDFVKEKENSNNG